MDVDDTEYADLIEWTAFDYGHTGPLNTFERSLKLRELLNDDRIQSEQHDLWPLEKSWRHLAERYLENGIDHYPDGWRGGARNPLQYLAACTSRGFYPPPEILWLVASCVQRYYSEGGDMSLDEVFFGSVHKKYKSDAFRQKKDGLYWQFSVEVDRAHRIADRQGKRRPSLEALAEPYFDAFIAFDDMDVDNFLRGYRRWKDE